MIKYETIISNFDDKTTLYNWLRKVEEALKHASATNFVVNKKGNATLSFSITFADGTTLESGDIVLQQGESVDGARIASGVLQLHLTNGTWLTAGNLGAVSNFSIDASQHLLVHYQDGTSQDLGAIFQGNVNITGNFTADSIIENMSGYSFTKRTEDLTWEAIYAGCVKNGNKLTFVVFGKITAPNATWGRLCYFSIPSIVASKLYPYTIGGANVLDNRKLDFTLSSSRNTIVEGKYLIEKVGYGGVYFQLENLDNLTQGEEYYFRIEQTFLLSDNLAS